jgi:hypothetical protein
MPLGLFKKFNDLLKKRKPMDTKRKKKKPHYSAAPGVSKDSVAGKLRSRNKRIADMADEADN